MLAIPARSVSADKGPCCVCFTTPDNEDALSRCQANWGNKCPRSRQLQCYTKVELGEIYYFCTTVDGKPVLGNDDDGEPKVGLPHNMCSSFEAVIDTPGDDPQTNNHEPRTAIFQCIRAAKAFQEAVNGGNKCLYVLGQCSTQDTKAMGYLCDYIKQLSESRKNNTNIAPIKLVITQQSYTLIPENCISDLDTPREDVYVITIESGGAISIASQCAGDGTSCPAPPKIEDLCPALRVTGQTSGPSSSNRSNPGTQSPTPSKISIVVHTMVGCQPCKALKAQLQQAKIPYTEIEGGARLYPTTIIKVPGKPTQTIIGNNFNEIDNIVKPKKSTADKKQSSYLKKHSPQSRKVVKGKDRRYSNLV